MDHRKEIDRLIRLDYSDWREFLVRNILVFAAALAIYSYLGWIRGFVWVGLFCLSHVIYYAILHSRPKSCTSADTVLAGLGFCVVMTSFVWFPVTLVHQDDIALRVPSMVGFCTFLVFLVRRADTVLWFVLAEVVVVATSVVVILFNVLPSTDHAGAKLVTVVAGVALVGYFAQTVQIHRQQRIERELAALRSIQAQKMEATGQLVGGVAHDFNNILTAVLGNLELYGVMEEPGERDHLVAEARQSAERAAELIRQLLAYSRQSQLQIETQSLRAVFEQVRNLSHRLLPSSIETVFAMPPEAIRIKVDQAQLITALINLLVNARDALEDGGRVSVEWRPTEMDGVATMPGGYAPKPGRYVEIAVQDNGPGIDPDQIERVTEPFFTTKPIGEGSGLGLSMVEGFARQSGGGLSIRSSEGGTRVSILLPLPERGEVQ